MASVFLVERPEESNSPATTYARWPHKISNLSEQAIAKIPPYSTINKVTAKIDIKRDGLNVSTSNADMLFYWYSGEDDRVGSYVLEEKNSIGTSYKTFTADITSYFHSGNELAGQVKVSNAIGFAFKGEGLLARKYSAKNRYITVEYTPPPPTWEYKVFPGTNKCFITKYNGNETDVTVPSAIDGYTVTRLGYGFHVNDFGGSEAANEVTGAAYYGTFSENSKITSVTIPSTVNWIGYQTFRKCTALQSITWNPNEECIIGRTCLHGCTALRLFNVPNNIKEVYDYAFQNCSALNRLNFKNKNVIFKTANNDDTVPVKTFSGTSDSLTLGLYHNVARTISDAIAGKQIYYYDAAVTFIFDGTTLKIDYVDIGAKPTVPPEPTKDGYIFKGWSDGTVTYASGELPAIQSSLSTGAIDVTYSAVFVSNKINNVYSGAVNANVYVGAAEVSAVYVGNTKIYG